MYRTNMDVNIYWVSNTQVLETQLPPSQMPETQVLETQVPPNDWPITFNIYGEIDVGGESFFPIEEEYGHFANVSHDHRDNANVGNDDYVPSVEHNDSDNHASGSVTRDPVSIPC